MHSTLRVIPQAQRVLWMDSERPASIPWRLRESGMTINNRDSVEAGIYPNGGIG